MRKKVIGITTALSLAAVPTIAQAGQPVRASSAMVVTAGAVAGESAGRESGTRDGMHEAGEGGGLSNGALAGMAIGLTGAALATYIIAHKKHHKSPSPR